MAKLARDLMTSGPACCTSEMTLDAVAKLMIAKDCGEIPVVDRSDRPIGVVTDRDIVCRIVADGKNPMAHSAGEAMSKPVITVRTSTPLDEIVATMEKHQIRRIPVIDDNGCLCGIISQADLARTAPEHDVAELVREVSREA